MIFIALCKIPLQNYAQVKLSDARIYYRAGERSLNAQFLSWNITPLKAWKYFKKNALHLGDFYF